MRHLIVLFIPTCLLGSGCSDKEDPRSDYGPHYATAWVVTPGGITRDAGPFGSVAAGYTTSEEIDAALDAARADFAARFPEYAWVNPLVHLSDVYSFYVSGPGGGFASGWNMGDGQIALAIWSRVETAEDPGDCWLKRPPGESFGVYYSNWRSTQRSLVPAYQHECLHIAIGDPTHSSALWRRLE